MSSHESLLVRSSLLFSDCWLEVVYLHDNKRQVLYIIAAVLAHCTAAVDGNFVGQRYPATHAMSQLYIIGVLCLRRCNVIPLECSAFHRDLPLTANC